MYSAYFADYEKQKANNQHHEVLSNGLSIYVSFQCFTILNTHGEL